MPNSPELAYAQVQDPFREHGYIRAGVEDLVGYTEEVVSAAAYDEDVIGIITAVVLDDDPCMAPGDFKKLKSRLEDEYGLSGGDLTRALYRCAQHVKKTNGISRVID